MRVQLSEEVSSSVTADEGCVAESVGTCHGDGIFDDGEKNIDMNDRSTYLVRDNFGRRVSPEFFVGIMSQTNEVANAVWIQRDGHSGSAQ